MRLWIIFAGQSPDHALITINCHSPHPLAPNKIFPHLSSLLEPAPLDDVLLVLWLAASSAPPSAIVLTFDLAQNEISSNAMAGVGGTDSACPMFHSNLVRDGKGGGIVLHAQCRGVFMKNRIIRNSHAGAHPETSGLQLCHAAHQCCLPSACGIHCTLGIYWIQVTTQTNSSNPNLTQKPCEQASDSRGNQTHFLTETSCPTALGMAFGFRYFSQHHLLSAT